MFVLFDNEKKGKDVLELANLDGSLGLRYNNESVLSVLEGRPSKYYADYDEGLARFNDVTEALVSGTVDVYDLRKPVGHWKDKGPEKVEPQKKKPGRPPKSEEKQNNEDKEVMAIISTFSTRNWKITFSQDSPDLTAQGVVVNGDPLTSLSSSGVTRDAVLHSPETTLDKNRIDTGVEGVSVIAVENSEIADYVDQVRWLLNTRLTPQDLSDRQILNPFLRTAEFETYDILGLTEAEYDSRAARDPQFEEKTRLSVLYRTAALMVPAIPDIVRQSVLNTTIQWAEYDPDKKIANFLRLSHNEIQTLVPDIERISGYAAGSVQKRRVLFQEINHGNYEVPK